MCRHILHSSKENEREEAVSTNENIEESSKERRSLSITRKVYSAAATCCFNTLGGFLSQNVKKSSYRTIKEPVIKEEISRGTVVIIEKKGTKYRNREERERKEIK